MSGGSKTSGSTSVASETTTLSNPITFYKSKTGKYPSNSQIWWTMKRPPELGNDEPPKIYLEVFDPSLRYQISLGNTAAPKGHFILKAFNQDRSGTSGVAGLTSVTSKGARPSAVAFYTGRVFWAGVFSEQFNTKIYFSPVIERADQVQQAYQEADPTAEDIRDLLPSDGGVIVIPEVAQVYHMVSYGPYLFVFADNGIWQIGGSQGAGFRANDYSVSKLSGTPTLSNLSFVIVEGAPFWWNRSGIQTLIANEQGQVQVKNVTEETIQTLYDAIPDSSKEFAKGAYDPTTKLVQWVYRSTAPTTIAEKFTYDKILTLNIVTGAWSPWDADNTYRVQMKGIFDLQGKVEEETQEPVTVNDVIVTANAVTVTSGEGALNVLDTKIKYIINVLDDDAAPATPSPVP